MLGDHRRKKDEIWKRDKNILRQGLINFRIWFRAANREMRGMLPFFILIAVILIIANVLPAVQQAFVPKAEVLPSCVTNCFWHI